ncbi:hypothetical protein [Aureispira anguillae]|uniref:Uncharacterized protein n=1 Tax=Aureispira anguillae TaxID=2864201 RepID=A0A915YGE4_9BACT|nr:hypothetical protein [Aureispira anguillae]BDS12677.1 hypothetical protein AsAng_0034010 [Aureispira anguillae]
MKGKDSQSEDRTSLAISNQNSEASNQTTDFVDNSREAQEARRLQNMADNSEESLKMQQWQNKIQQSEENSTGLPDELKTNLENMSGMALDHVKVHYNSSKPAKLGAYAYAKFPNIYIAPGQEKYLPEEAWHMVQQMQGRVGATQNVNGTPINDNPSLEKEAIQEGKKAANSIQQNKKKDLVQKKGQQGVVQRAKIEKKSHYGTFSVDDAKYKFINSDGQLDLDLTFEPTGNADATKVGLVQVIKDQKNGKTNFIDPNSSTKATKNGSYVDQLSDNLNPLYATGGVVPAKDDDKLESYSTPDGTHATKDPVKGWTPANIKDKPSISGGANSMKEFETSALALEGKDKGEYYGSVKWGWERDGSGNLSKIDFDLVSMGVPSKNFMEAAEKWNNGKARGTLVVKNDNTDAVSMTLVKQFELQKGDEVIQKETLGSATQSYISFEVKTSSKDATLIGKTGIMKIEELEDKGDGKDTVDLPMIKVLVPTEDDVFLYKDHDRRKLLIKLKSDTRMKKIDEDEERGMVQIEIVDGEKITKEGWVSKSKVKDE